MWKITSILILLMGLNLSAQTPQIIRGPYLQLGTDTSVIVRWRTDIVTDSIVNYGSAIGSLTSSVSDGTLKTEHSQGLQIHVLKLLQGERPNHRSGLSIERKSSAADVRKRERQPMDRFHRAHSADNTTTDGPGESARAG